MTDLEKTKEILDLLQIIYDVELFEMNIEKILQNKKFQYNQLIEIEQWKNNDNINAKNIYFLDGQHILTHDFYYDRETLINIS